MCVTASALEPANGMEADHERLLQFFEQTLNTLRAIEDAAAASDRAAVLSGSQDLGTLRVGTLADLSDAFAPIVAVHFRER